MPLPLSNIFEGGTDETTITTGNSGGTSGDAFEVVTISAGGMVYDTARAAHGSVSARVDIVSNLVNVEWRGVATGGDWTAIRASCYVYFTANPTAGVRLIGIFNSAGARQADLIVQSSGVIRVSDSAFTSLDSVGAILLNQWTRLELFVVHSTTNGVIEGKIYDFDNPNPITNGVVSTPDNRNTGTAAQRAAFGQIIANAQTTTFWMDDIQLGATAIAVPDSRPRFGPF